jgi:folate-dependent phosphoribosylglycinamide formyltransferase PurN
LRIALFTLEGACSASAVLRFAERHADRIALVGRSDPFGNPRTAWRAFRRSGPAILPYLFCEFALPTLSNAPGAKLSALCRERGIPSLTLRDVNGTAVRQALRDSGAELILSFHFDRIFDAETLAIPRLGGLNIHPSLLPRHRGPIPAFHALAEGATGVTLHALAPRIDAGGIWAQREVPLPQGLSAAAAARALHEAALPLLDEVLPRIAAGERPPPPPALLPYRGWPTPAQRRASGVQLLDRADWAAARRAPAGGWV